MDFASELPPSEDFEPRTLEERQMLDQVGGLWVVVGGRSVCVWGGGLIYI